VTFYLSSIHPLRPLRLCVTLLFKLKIKNVSRQDAKTPRKSILFVFSSIYPLRPLRPLWLCVTCLSSLKSKSFLAKTQRRQENLFFG